MPTLLGFSVMRFFRGAGCYSIYMILFVMTVETMHPSSVMFLSTTFNFAFALGCMTLCLEAYLVRDWMHLTIVANIPIAMLCVLYFVCPESPRWLLSMGRTTRAWEVMSHAARLNGKDPSIVDACAVKQPATAQRKARFRDLFVSGLRWRVLNLAWQWFTIILSYYGLIYASTDLAGNKHVNFMLSFVMEIFANIFVILTLNWIGRRRLLVGCQLLNGLSCVAGGLLQGAEISTLSIAFCMIGKFFASCAFSNIYLYTTELAPTPVRTQTVGMCSAIGRLGGVLSYLIKLLTAIWIPFPTVLIGCGAIVAGVCALALPETVGLPLPDTVEEAKSLKHRTPVYAKFPRSFTDVFVAPTAKRCG